MSSNIAPVNKTVDTFVSQKNCSLCQLKYNLYKREHRCKRCFRSICQDCGLIKRYIIGYNVSPNVKHKVCYLCGKDSYDMQTLSEKYNLRWACDSIVGQNWITSLYDSHEINKEKFMQTLKADQEFTEQSKKSEAYSLYENFAKNSYQELKDILKRNYSFREMLYYLQKYDNTDKIIKDILQVLRAFVNRYYDVIGFCLELVDITIFLLCFNTPPSAYAILRNLYGNILNSNMYPSSIRYYFSGDTLYQGTMLKSKIFQDSIMPGKNAKVEKQDFKTKNEQIANYLLDVMKNLYPIDIGIIPVLQKFFELQALPFILSFMVMKVNFTCSYYIMNEIITSKKDKRSHLLIKSFIATTYCNLDSIKYGSQNPSQVLQNILDNTQLKYLRQNLKHHAEIRDFQTKDGGNQLTNYKKKIQQLEQENGELQRANESLISQLETISEKQEDLISSSEQMYSKIKEDPNYQSKSEIEQYKNKIDNFKSQFVPLNSQFKQTSDNNDHQRNSNLKSTQHDNASNISGQDNNENQKKQAESFKPIQAQSIYQVSQGNSQIQQQQEQNDSENNDLNSTLNLETKIQEQQKIIENLETDLKQAQFKLEKYENRQSQVSNTTEEQSSDQESKQSVLRNSKSQKLDMTIQLQEKEQEIVQLKLENQELQDKLTEIENQNNTSQKQIKDMKKSIDQNQSKSDNKENSDESDEKLQKLTDEKQVLENIISEQHDEMEKEKEKIKELEKKFQEAEKQKKQAQEMANQLNNDNEAKDQIISELEEQITKYQLLQDQINEQIQAYNQEQQPDDQMFDPKKSSYKNSKKSEMFQSIFDIQKNPKNSEIEDPELYNKIRDQVKQENKSKVTGFEQNIQNMQELLAQLQKDVDNSDSDEEFNKEKQEQENKNKQNQENQENQEEEFEEVELGKAE